jgi:hypothetical protein
MMKLSALGAIGLFLCLQVNADTIPDCTSRGQQTPINNSQVLDWKYHTKNQFHSRGHIQGIITLLYPDHTGHHHIETKIGPAATDTIEVIYNEDFGPVPNSMAVGSTIEACGDYITSNAQSGGFPASPDGALVHWVHRSPNPKHDSGFMVIDGVLCGQQ